MGLPDALWKQAGGSFKLNVAGDIRGHQIPREGKVKWGLRVTETQYELISVKPVAVRAHCWVQLMSCWVQLIKASETPLLGSRDLVSIRLCNVQSVIKEMNRGNFFIKLVCLSNLAVLHNRDSTHCPFNLWPLILRLHTKGPRASCVGVLLYELQTTEDLDQTHYR